MLSRAEALRSTTSQQASEEPSTPLTPAQMKEVDESFAVFDYSETGTLNLHEIKVLMRSLGFPVRRTEVPFIVHQVNPDSDGPVDLQTFRLIMEKRYASLDPEEEIVKAFRLFDTDGTGKITIKNLRRVSRDLGDKLGERELQAMIDEFDKNLDGYISLEQFTHVMQKEKWIEK